MIRSILREYGIPTAVVLVVSPLLMAILGLITVFDWGLLSNIGQSFGGVSALLSAVALLAIVRSNRLLQTQNQVNLDQTTREMQFRILELALGDPELQQTYSTEGPLPPLTMRQRSFLAMRIRYFEYAYLNGALDDSGLRVMLSRETFPAPLTREYWSANKDIWAAHAKNDRERRFVDVLNRAQHDLEASSG